MDGPHLQSGGVIPGASAEAGASLAAGMAGVCSGPRGDSGGRNEGGGRWEEASGGEAQLLSVSQRVFPLLLSWEGAGTSRKPGSGGPAAPGPV